MLLLSANPFVTDDIGGDWDLPPEKPFDEPSNPPINTILPSGIATLL
jgi:hypothetical protein